jgi:hypothetical protein
MPSFFLLKCGLVNFFFTGLAWNLDLSDLKLRILLILPSIWDYKCEPPVPVLALSFKPLGGIYN